MYIDKLVLVNAKRLMVRGIKYFSATFDSLYQIILGTNGSGKSYILSESSPLPASPKMFAKGGRKEFHCRHNGSSFVLINDFETAAGRHSFIVDGVDLNENGTSTIQRELVAKYFNNLTPEIFNVLTFRKFSRFTEMDSTKRRQWMMMMSGIDLDWAMEVYQALRVRSRDATGHVKRVQTKLASEIQMSIDDSDIEKMQNRLTKMQADFKEALQLSKSGVPTLEDIERLLQPKLFQLDALNSDLNRYMSTLENGMCNFGVTSKDGVRRYLTTIEANIANLDATLTRTYEDKSRVDGELIKLKELGAEGLNEYEEIISKLEVEANASLEAIQATGFGLCTEQSVIIGMNAYIDNLVKHTTEVLSSMFDNSNALITLEKTDLYRNEEMMLMQAISELQKRIEALTHRINHSKETSDVECPSCSFVFKPGFRGDFEVEAPRVLAEMEVELKTKQERLKEVHVYLNDVQAHVTGLRNFEKLQSMYSGYQGLWEEIGNFGIETNNPKLALAILDRYVGWVTLHSHLGEINKSLEEKRRVYDQAKQIDSKDMQSTQDKANELEAIIESTLAELSLLRKKHEGLSNLAKTLEVIDECIHVSEILVEEIDSILENEEDAQANVLLDNVLRTLQGEMETLETQVSTIRVQRAIVEDLKQTLEQANFEQGLYKFLADELSPTDGLIADILRKFIESFTENQSNIISSIWSYPLIVLPCISNKDGLDYKFPIRVFGSSLPIPDISEGSDAQVDVVDFTFVVMFRKLLGFEDFPLYLDEPISRMDEIHRIEMIRIIQSMVESNQCSQMFFISHFAAQHGSFADSQTMVMDSSNIVNLPTIFNKHCVIK